MGFKSVEQLCLALFDALADADDFVRTEIVHNQHIAGLQSWTQNLVQKAEETSRSVGASMVMAAMMPRLLIAPTRVRICQLPCAVPSWTRCPPGARPYKRVMRVVTPLSSRKINFSGAIVRRRGTNSSRRRPASSVSRSLAWSDFFSDVDPASATGAISVAG